MPHYKNSKSKGKTIYTSLGNFLTCNRLAKDSTRDILAYWNFIYAKRKERGCTAFERYDGIEKHHIVPRSFGGMNNPKNYVNLTKTEHMMAHILLKNAIFSSEKFTAKLRNKTTSSVPRIGAFVKEWLQPKHQTLLIGCTGIS